MNDEIKVGDSITDGTTTGAVRQIIGTPDDLYGYLVGDAVIRAADARKVDPEDRLVSRELVLQVLRSLANGDADRYDIDEVLPISSNYDTADELVEAFKAQNRQKVVSREVILATLRAVAEGPAETVYLTLDSILPFSTNYHTARELVAALTERLGESGNAQDANTVSRADVLTALNETLDYLRQGARASAATRLDRVLPVTEDYVTASALVDRILALTASPATNEQIGIGDFVGWDNSSGLVTALRNTYAEVITVQGGRGTVLRKDLTLIAKAR